jgi:hypothetical protein
MIEGLVDEGDSKMSNYHQQKRWRATYRGVEGRSGFVLGAVGSEGWAEMAAIGSSLISSDPKNYRIGWEFLADEPWEGFDEKLVGDGKPRLFADDDELDFPNDPEITLPRLDAMKAAILHIANQITGPTFTRFCELVPHFSGPRIFSFPETRIHLWHGLSSLAIKALKDLSKEGKLVAERAPFALYSIDGASNSVMRLPRVVNTPSEPQPQDSWLPLVFWTIEQIAKARGKREREASRIILTDGGRRDEKESWETTTDWMQAEEPKAIQGQIIWEGKLEAPLPRLVETIYQREELEESRESLNPNEPQTKTE